MQKFGTCRYTGIANEYSWPGNEFSYVTGRSAAKRTFRLRSLKQHSPPRDLARNQRKCTEKPSQRFGITLQFDLCCEAAYASSDRAGSRTSRYQGCHPGGAHAGVAKNFAFPKTDD